MTEEPTPYGASPFDRLCTEFDSLPKKELAKKLNTTVHKLSDAETTGTIPAEWLLTLLRTEGINPDWVITGQGAKKLMPSIGNHHDPTYKNKFLQIRFCPPRECTTEELLKELFRRVLVNFPSP